MDRKHLSPERVVRVVEVIDMVKDFTLGVGPVHGLIKITFRIERGEFVSIIGPPGWGKSISVRIIGCLDKQTSGTCLLEGISLNGLGPDQLAEIRNKKIGFVCQQFNLRSGNSAAENVEVSLNHVGVAAGEARERAIKPLQAVGMAGHEDRMPSRMSGCEQQRVAIARAIVNQPAIVLADEPTGALDARSSMEILAIFQRLNREYGITIMLATHDPDLAKYSKRAIHIAAGKIESDTPIIEPRDAVRDLENIPASPSAEAAPV